MARWLQRATRDDPCRIAYAGFNAPYPLTGERLANAVLFVPRNETGSSWYGFGYPLRSPLDSPSREAWRANLSRYRVDFLVTSSHDRGEFVIEDEWARDWVPLVFANDSYHVYAITRRAMIASAW